MQHYRSSNYNTLTPMVKNLIIINAIMFLATYVLGSRGIADLKETLALYYPHPESTMFQPWQILTHFFMHADMMHIFMNMFGLFMFGRMLEVRWGPKRFLFFYMVTAFFAAALHYLVVHFQVQSLINSLDPSLVDAIMERAYSKIPASDPAVIDQVRQLNQLVNTPAMGASGAIFGILGACYVLFPNTLLYLIFPPIPIKLKLAVTLYGLYELYRGLQNAAGDNVAHFAHLGGLLAGIIIVKYWNKTRRDTFF